MAVKYMNTIKFSKELTPKAFQAKVKEVLEEKVCETQEEAEELVESMEFELELYYENGTGLLMSIRIGRQMTRMELAC
jgi:uncharacterized protein YdhG (YjbR/CyaY superfamily)